METIMINTNSFIFIVYLILLFGSIIVIWFFLSKIFNEYRQRILEMMINGTYKAWVRENRVPWSMAKLFDYGAILCFVGFILLSIAKVSFDVTILFKLFFPFKLISIILHLVLYRKLPVNESEIV
jgi:hypothetical protein